MSRKRLRASPLIEVLLAGDHEAATRLSRAALGQCGSRANLVSDYMQPALYAISELWYQGRVQSSTEQSASEIMIDVLRQLPPTPSPRPVPAGSRILLSALEGDPHVLGLATLGELLRDEGWTVVELQPGQFGDLVETAAEIRPYVVAISCGYLPDQHKLGRTIIALKAQRTRVLVGGAAINRTPGLWSRLGADGTGLDARVAIVAARQQLSHHERRAQVEDLFRQRAANPLLLRRARSGGASLGSVRPLKPAS